MNKKRYFLEKIKRTELTREKLFLSAVYLFSMKGYDNVGMRELCSFIGIKAASFYNHYPSKEDLFNTILNEFEIRMTEVIFSEEEISEIVDKGNIQEFFRINMEKFSSITGNPLFFTMLQIIFMESYKNKRAYEIAIHNVYYVRREYTESVLKKMLKKGCIKDVDVELVTAEYYYTLKGLLDEYLLQEVWGEDIDYLLERIKKHIYFFVKLLSINEVIL